MKRKRLNPGVTFSKKFMRRGCGPMYWTILTKLWMSSSVTYVFRRFSLVLSRSLSVTAAPNGSSRCRTATSRGTIRLFSIVHLLGWCCPYDNLQRRNTPTCPSDYRHQWILPCAKTTLDSNLELKWNSTFQPGTEVELEIQTWKWSGAQDSNLELKWDWRFQPGTGVEFKTATWNWSGTQDSNLELKWNTTF